MSKLRHIYTIIDGKSIDSAVEQPITAPFTGKTVAILHQPKLHSLPIYQLTKQTKNKTLSVFELLGKYLEKNKNSLAVLAAEETGSPLKYHLDDISAIVRFISQLNCYQPSWAHYYQPEPKGSALIVLSANEPIIMSLVPLITALLSQNTVFLKASSKTPSFSSLIVKKLLDLGLDRNRLHYLTIDKDPLKELIQSGVFACILSFGHHRTNQILGVAATIAGTEFIPENDGNDWVYLDNSFPFTSKKLIAILMHAFTKHNGQMCDSTRGILVHQKVHPALVDGLKKEIKLQKIGDPLKTDSKIGALLAGTLSHAVEIVKQAHGDADEVYNHHCDGNVFYPTLVVNPSLESKLIQEGIFAPAIWIKPVTNHEQALKLYEKYNQHGLSFSVFSDKEDVIRDFIVNIRAGRINVNTDPVEVSIFSPWGGIKKSGFGGPAHWIERLVNKKLINYGQY